MRLNYGVVVMLNDMVNDYATGLPSAEMQSVYSTVPPADWVLFPLGKRNNLHTVLSNMHNVLNKSI